MQYDKPNYRNDDLFLKIRMHSFIQQLHGQEEGEGSLESWTKI